MAVGLTRIWGRTLLSIFRRSRGNRPYFAINSDFLNSPDTRVTRPLLSNSVQRSFSSVPAGLRDRALDKLKSCADVSS